MNTVARTTLTDPRSLRFIALLVTYLQSVNLPLPNAALRLIQGSLSMSDDQAGWIFTSYLAASAITLPVAQWLAAYLGLKRVYQGALLVLMLGLWLGTVAETPLAFVGARFVQGLASGVLAPLSMAIALETLPTDRRAAFGPKWTALVLLGIVSGPSIGGLASEHFGWRPMFYLSLPVLASSLMGVTLLLAEKKSDQRPAFDFFGFTCFSLGMISLQMFLDRGPRLDWFDSLEIWVEMQACALGFYLFFVHRMTTRVHFFSKELVRDRNFIVSTMMFFALGFVLLSTMALTSPMLDEILGYPPDTTGLLTLPRGIGLVGAFVLMGRAPTRVDIRVFIAIGIGLVVYGNALMLEYSPLMDWTPVATSGFIQGAGIGMLMPALSKAAFSTLNPALRPEAAGLFNLMRVYGSTLGVAVVQVFFFNNTQMMHSALVSHLTPFGAALPASLQALERLNHGVTHQAAFIALMGQFKVLLLAMLVVSPLVLFLRKPA